MIKKILHTKYCIIGAGISGLSFASKIKNDDYIILEKDNEIGGYCKTIKQHGYTWDYGGHFFHFKDKKIKNEFKSFLKSESIVKNNKVTKIYYKKNFIDYPFQNNIHQLPFNEFLDCLYDLVVKKNVKNEKNFVDMVRNMYGDSISNKFLIPYNKKLYACKINSLDKNAMGRFFPKSNLIDIVKNFKNIKSNTYNDEFFYSKNGAIDFVNVILKRVNQDNIYLNSCVKHINVKKHIIETDKFVISYRYLINTSPLSKFLQIISIKNSVKFSSNKVVVLNLGFDKSSFDKKIHWCYFPENKYIFYRVGFYNNILHQKRLSLYVEVGYKSTHNINNYQNVLFNVLKDLKKVGIIKSHKLLSYSIVDMNPAYVHIENKTNNKIKKILEKLNMFDIYSIGRYGMWTYCSIEDCIIMAYDLYKNINLYKN